MWAKSDATGVLDHPSRIFLIDARGRQREIYNLEFLKPETVLEDVRVSCCESPVRIQQNGFRARRIEVASG